MIQEVDIRPGLKRRLRVDKSSYPNRGTFLIHSACHRLLIDGMPFGPEPAELFNLCQALEPDKLRFGDSNGAPTAGKSIHAHQNSAHIADYPSRYVRPISSPLPINTSSLVGEF